MFFRHRSTVFAPRNEVFSSALSRNILTISMLQKSRNFAVFGNELYLADFFAILRRQEKSNV